MSKIVYIRGMEQIPDKCESCDCCFMIDDGKGTSEHFCVFDTEPISYYIAAGLRSEYCPLKELEVSDNA